MGAPTTSTAFTAFGSTQPETETHWPWMVSPSSGCSMTIPLLASSAGAGVLSGPRLAGFPQPSQPARSRHIVIQAIRILER